MRDPSHIPPSERPEVRADRDALSGQAAAAGPEPAGMLMDRLLELEELRNTPADYAVVRLTAAIPSSGAQLVDGIWWSSVAVINRSAATILVGLGGQSATPDPLRYTIAPQTAVVLPISVRDLVIGADPADAGLPATVHVLRYQLVQPFNACRLT